MSYGATALVACETIQGKLDDHFSTCDASNMIEPTPFLDFVLSPFNSGGVDQEVTPGSGKILSLRLKYFQRLLESEVKSDQANPVCVASTKRGQCSEVYTIDEDNNEQVEELIESKDLNRNCDNLDEYLTGVVARLMGALVRKVATKTTAEAAALTGAWDSEVANIPNTTLAGNTLQVPIFKSGTTDEVAPFTMQGIDMAALSSGYCDTPICFSDFSLKMYYDRVLAGCCANQGVDLGAIAREFGKAVVYDRRIRAAFGSNFALMTQPKALQLLQYAHNEFFTDGGVRNLISGGTDSRKIVVFAPNGLKVDMNVKEDCGNINIVLTSTTELINMPSDMFPTGDSKDGVNFANKIEVVN
jgi:hypothetical protein